MENKLYNIPKNLVLSENCQIFGDVSVEMSVEFMVMSVNFAVISPTFMATVPE